MKTYNELMLKFGEKSRNLIKSIVPPILEQPLKNLVTYLNLRKERLEYVPEGWNYYKKSRNHNMHSVSESVLQYRISQ